MTAELTAAAELPATRGCPFGQPAVYERLRTREPIAKVGLPGGKWAWAVTRHEDVRAVLASPDFSADRTHPDFPSLLAEGGTIRKPTDEKSMVSMDPPEHGEARRAVLGEFTVRRVEAMRPRVQRIVDDHIDAILAGPKPAELVSALALPVPSLVICELLGVPYADHEFFQANTARMVHRGTRADDRRRSFENIQGYLTELVAGKETGPPDDLLGRQITARRADGTYRRAAVAALGMTLLLAGHETTANMIGAGTAALLTNPDQLAALRRSPDRIPAAVEELLRFLTIVDTVTTRRCVADTEIGGVTIRAGEGVIALGQAANWDPTVFPDPDRLDITRGGRHHVAFGFGPHQCLGQNLARLELHIVFETLLTRLPTLALATPLADIPFKDDTFVYGVHRLPITW